MDSSIKFNVSANTAQFDAAMKRVGSVAQTTGDRVRSAFSGLGSLLAGGAVVAGLQGILRKMDDISDRAKRFGVTAEEIQRVGNAADLVGTNFESVARTIARAGVAASKAAREGGSVAEAFARVNLDPAAFAAATLEERIRMIAAAQRDANGDAQKMNEILEVVGVKAAGINFSELATEMQNVNVAGADVVERLAEANDQLEKMQQGATIFGANLLKALLIDPAQRLGSFLGGGGFKTIDELQRKQIERQAKSNLQARGELLPDDTKVRPAMVKTPVGSVPGGESLVAGPNAEENARRIAAEVDRIQKAQSNAATAARDMAAAYSDTADAADSIADRMDKAVASKTKPTASRQDQLYVGKLTPEYQPIVEKLKSLKEEAIKIYDQQLTELQMIGGSGTQNSLQKIDLLNRQYDEAVADIDQKLNRAYAMSLEQLKETSMPQTARNSTQPRAAEAEQRQIATETTLQKVAKFLEELNTKLPQPVLV